MDNHAIPALLPVYRRYDLAFARGEGAWLYTTDGRRMLDFASGIAVTGLGHAHPHLLGTIAEQAGKLWHVSNLFQIPELERLADRLVAHTFADTVFVCNSGAEAIEGCIKIARRYHWARGNPERNRIIAERLVDRDVFNNMNFLGWLNANPPPAPRYAPPMTGPMSAPAATGAPAAATEAAFGGWGAGRTASAPPPAV